MKKPLYLIMYLLFFLGGCNEEEKMIEKPEVIITQDFPNATNLNNNEQLEVVTWNIRQFPQNKTYTEPYVQSLLEAWNADVYLFQEISNKIKLLNMVDSMDGYSAVVDDESGNLGFALVYKKEFITFNTKKELWADTPRSDDGDIDYSNNAQYQFASRPPMESYVTWSNGSKSIDLYLINVHYKCCGDDTYDINDSSDETSRRHHSSLLLTEYLINNRSTDKVIIVGDFNNVGDQAITNPTISPFTDNISFQYSKGFKMMDQNILISSPSGFSWQGWTSSYSPAHFDHIIINEPLFSYIDSAIVGVIDTPKETGFTPANVVNRISDHQPVFLKFLIDN